MEPTLSAGTILARLAIVFALVLANAFFVATEFALVAARKTRIDALAEEGNRRAQMAREAITHLDRYISGTQLGITLASLGLGWVGESTIAAILIQVFDGLPEPFNVLAAHGVAVPVAFAILTFLLIVLGELGPKSVALLHPERIAIWASGPLVLFSKIFSPFIALLNRSARLLLRLLGLQAPTEMERVHRPEEIEMLLLQTFEHGLLAEEPVDMIRGVFDLSEITAEEVMTPRTEVVAVPEDATIEEAAAVILRHGHSRIPVYRESLDQIVGIILAREVWRAEHAGEIGIAGLIRPVIFVPDSKDLEALLVELQQQHTHIAVVVDEFGGTAGIITLEDVVEEIVGDIRDEYETAPPEIEETPTGEIILSGGVPVFELNEEYGLKLPEAGYATVAGYVLGRLGRIAREGDEVIFPGGKLDVLEMDGRRIDRLALTLAKPRAETSPEE